MISVFSLRQSRLIGFFCVLGFLVWIVAPAQAELCVGSLLSNEVLRYDEATGASVGTCASEGGLAEPRGIAFGPDGNLYVSSYSNHSILRYDGTTGVFIDAFVPSGVGGLFQPQGLTFAPDNNLYVASFINVLRYDGTTGAFIDTFASPVIGGVFDLVFGPDGNLYVGTFGNVQRFDGTTGAFIDVFASAGIAGASGLVFGGDGNLYIGSNLSNEVVRFDATGALLGAFVTAFSGGLSGPLGVTFGPDGQLYVASRDTDSVLRYDGATGAFVDTFVPPGSGGLDNPVFLAFTPAANAPPDCSTAVADPTIVWPPNQGMVPIRILVTDPDEDPIINTVTGFTQDEPVSGPGYGNTAPDAWIGPYDPMVRAERSGMGNGRVYFIHFIAVDDKGGTCEGAIPVCVPRDNSPASLCIDDGQNYDSTLGP
jgi:DNA-binding beta-propeller fold protein YncE